VALNMVVHLRRDAGSFDPELLPEHVWTANLFGRATNSLVLADKVKTAYEEIDREMKAVAAIQRSLLPAKLPEVPSLHLAANYETARRAGGDYYDFIPLGQGLLGILIADVSGHGTPAAVVMAMIHTLLHAFPGPLMPPTHVLSHVNRHLASLAPEGMFATALYGIYDPYYRRFRYASAGHPAPRLRSASGRIQPLETPAGLPLAILPEDSWTEREILLTPGDVLLLYTDGIVEGANAAGEPFGLARFDDAFRLGPKRAGPLVQHIERYYRDFRDGAPDMDDRTLLAAVAVP
jgi:phosphoserine phosphatase RsbU/P